ncbi:GlxA family transcriptional regulator [Litchfieldella xinjiangensis]|uniref:GlxA family transcriptional regulator n=1 Tax=Litchfieldella xinjiangensis TaxID=1166948 RepID=UPI0005BBFFC9|nr:GlxA family transcriptional regulator [Halomonas xinjiangensis]
MNNVTSNDWPYLRPDLPPVPRPGEAEHTVSVWLLPKFSMLSLICLLEPLRVANRFGRKLFAWELLSATGEAVVASNGVRIDVDGPLAAVSHCEMLMVISSYEAEATVTPSDRAVLRQVAAHGALLGGLDTAPFILARAGLFEHQKVALHWESVPAFQEEFPHLAVSEARFEFTDQRLTGSGGAAGIDMMLQWIEHDYGPALANAVGRQLIHNRVADEETWENALRQQYDHLPRSVAGALAIMEAHLGQALTIPEICRLVGQSQRQLTRLFLAHLGMRPKQCYLGMRLDQARRILADSRCRVTEAALATGFNHLSHFTRAYQERFNERPSVTSERGTT